MEQDAWKESFDRVEEGARSLKEVALNRYDRDFEVWHRQARSVLLRYGAVKIPAFDEIRFASDFFLGKDGDEQKDINDRIALVSDIDLALEIIATVRAQVADELRLKKSRERIGGGASLEHSTSVPTPQEPPEALPPDSSLSLDDFDQLLALVEASDFSRREKEDALEEIERVRQVLTGGNPDWDRIKRTLKFFLDFDKVLALEAIPVILQSYKKIIQR